MMSHLSEHELVLYHYGEAQEPLRRAIEGHLASCPSCREVYHALEHVLAAADSWQVPERGENYAEVVWQRVRPSLEKPASIWGVIFEPRRWAVVGALVALLAVAFLAGRFWPRRQAPLLEPISQLARERILLVAVGDHLERSQWVLIELVNTRGGPGKGMVDISPERERAQDLVESNRLYRQAALRAGEMGMASVLDDLERILLEIAHSPSKVSSTKLEEFRRRIEAQGILFKVRVIGSQVEKRERAGGQGPATAGKSNL